MKNSKAKIEKFNKIEKWLPPKSKWSKEANFNHKTYFDVYCITSGKSGSTSIFESLSKMGNSAIHVHTTNYFLRHVVRKPRPPYANFSIMDYVNFEMSKSNHNPLLIDVIRDPLSRIISAFFQNLHIHYKPICRWHRMDLNFQEFIEFFTLQPKFLIRYFNNHFVLKLENYVGCEEWLGDGLDIYSLNFDKNKPFQQIDHNDKTFLLLKFTEINNWSVHFRDLGFSNFELVSANESQKKTYGNLYNEFKKQYQIPDILLEIIYDFIFSNRLNLLYTRKEIGDMKSKWQDRVNGLNPVPSHFNWKNYLRRRPKLHQKFRSELGAKYHYLTVTKHQNRTKRQQKAVRKL